MKIITTVGTSIFTNKWENNAVRVAYKDIPENESADGWEDLSKAGNIKKLATATKNAWENNEDDSAEIKSICAIAGELKEDVEVYLLATDTVLSVLACLLIMEWFEKNHNKSQFLVTFKAVDKEGKDVSLTKDNRENLRDELVVKDLRVMSDSSSSSANNIDDATINSGFLNLIDKIQAIIKPGQKNRDGFILNISGGYKAFIPILTIMGQLYNIPLKYIYADSDRLVNIDQFPINFDWGVVDLFMPYLNDLPSVQPPEKMIERLKEFHLVAQKGNKYVRSSMGELLKKFYNKPNVMPTSSTVLGFYVEYKLYEYFHKYCNNVLCAIDRSVSIEGSAEIDLQLISKNCEIFACEVKPLPQVQSNFGSNILEPAKKRILLYESKGKTLKVYYANFLQIERTTNGINFG